MTRSRFDVNPLRFGVLMLLTCCLSFPSHVSGANPLQFTIENMGTGMPSLGQLLNLRVSGWDPSSSSDPSMALGDTAYFALTTATCATATPSGSTQITPTVSVSTRTATISNFLLRASEFAVGSSYKLCYILSGGSAVYSASRLSGDFSALDFIVLNFIYSDFTTTPSSVRAGQGPISISMTEVLDSRRDRNTGTQYPFLIPCSNCADYDATTLSCSGGQSTGSTIIINSRTVNVATITGRFFAPIFPTSSYHICFPYTTKNSNQDVLAWSVVRTVTVTFLSRSPATYSVSPSAPNARMAMTLSFTGTGLTALDTVKVVASGSVCGSSDSLLGLSMIGGVSAPTSSSSTASALYTLLPTTSFTAQVCYSRSDAPGAWFPVFLASSTTSDLVIKPITPSTVTKSRSTIRVGEAFFLTITGEGLSATTDDAYLVLSQSSICSTNDQCTVSGASTYPCGTLAAAGTNTVQCNNFIDRLLVDSDLTMCLCYKPSISSNYVMVDTIVTVSPRSPKITFSPVPWYGGQRGDLILNANGMQTSDSLKFIAGTDSCDTGTTLGNVSFSEVTGSSTSTQRTFNVVATPSTCVKVCYQFTANSFWNTLEYTSSSSTNPGCASNLLYSAPFGAQYVQSPSVVRVKGTITNTYTAVSGFTMPISLTDKVKVVAVGGSNCIFSVSCGSAVCDGASVDEFSAGTVLTQPVSDLQSLSHLTTAGSYVMCVSLQVGTTNYIPVLNGANGWLYDAAGYVFAALAANPTGFTLSPTVFRVALGSPTITVQGTGLSSADLMNVILPSVLPKADVCPVYSTSTALVLDTTTLLSSSSSSTMYLARGTSTVTAGTVVAVCYYLGASRIPSFISNITFLGPNPASVTAINPTLANLRASISTTLQFAGSGLSESDTVFYFLNDPQCRCGSECTASNRINSTLSLTGDASTRTLTDPQGFPNYLSSGVFTVCYFPAGQPTSTFLGTLTAGQAHPTYYSVADTVKVGVPFDVTVTRSCSTCSLLVSTDELILVQNSRNCVDATTMDPSLIESRSVVVVLTGGTAVRRSFVGIVNGTYRVCYRLSAETTFQEVANRNGSNFYSRSAIPIGAANPLAFSVFPTSPLSGQRIVVTLTCDGGSCACQSLRLVSGVQSSCWTTPTTVYTSTSCGSGNTFPFHGVMVNPGTYTLCFGAQSDSASRVPGTLTVGNANPSGYTSPKGVRIYTNQATDVVMLINGLSGTLTTSDQALFLPNLQYSCHDLELSPQVVPWSGSDLAFWDPSANPNPLEAGSSSTEIVFRATTSSKRFGDSILTRSYCNSSTPDCVLQLCYKLSGASWAFVTFSSSLPLVLNPANPQSISLDRSTIRVTQYLLATVNGTSLSLSDDLYFVSGECDTGTVVGRAVGTPTLSADATIWRATVRMTVRANVPKPCYDRGGSVVQFISYIATQNLQTIFAAMTYRRPSAFDLNFTYSRFQQFQTSFWISDVDMYTDINRVLLLSNPGANHCPYPGFTPNAPTAGSLTAMTAPTGWYQMRLLQAGTFGLCLYGTGGEVFLVLGDRTRDLNTLNIPVLNAHPQTYSTVPSQPMVQQAANYNFAPSTDGTGLNILAANDTFQIIQGSLYECGTWNATIVANASGSLSYASGTGISSGLLVSSTTGSGWTLCYKRAGGDTWAAVQLSGAATVDRQTNIIALTPSAWIGTPSLPQVRSSMTIEFDAKGVDALTTSDQAKLVLVANTRTSPLASDCELAGTQTSTAALTKLSSFNTVWQIDKLSTVGNFTVCYLRQNGRWAVVPSPGLLTVSPRASPYNVTSDLPTGTTLIRREMFRLRFLSSETLSYTLDQTDVTKDRVAFSSTPDCSSLLSGAVEEIPSSFGYNPVVSGETLQFLRLRLLTSSNFYVCVKRVNRTATQGFFNYEAIGSPDEQVLFTVLPAAVTTAALNPTTARALVPNTAVALTTPNLANSPYSSIVLAFFALHMSSSDDDLLITDGCYLPTAADANTGVSVLRNTSVSASGNVVTFPAPGRWRYCYQLTSRNIASYPVTLVVSPVAPKHYSVPSTLRVGAAFTMTFASDVSMLLDSGNDIRIHVLSSGAPDCSISRTTNIAPGTSPGFTISGTGTTASATIRITSSGTFFVCFKAFDQLNARLLPLDTGATLFTIGVDGPVSYTISPTTPFQGQTVTLTVAGTNLTSSDRGKVVDVSSFPQGTLDFSTACTDGALSANVENPIASGDSVAFASSIETSLTARIALASQYVLCYKGPSTGWSWVKSPASFNVGPPHPTRYVTIPSSPYATQQVGLTVSDDASLLTVPDTLKLVEAGANPYCTDAALATTEVTSIVDSVSTTSRVLRVCRSSGATSIRVCYKLNGFNWAEAPTNTGQYAPLTISSNPFTGPTVPSQRRIRQPISVAFASLTTAAISYFNLYLGSVSVCDFSAQITFPQYTQPLSYKTSGANSFEVVVATPGTYTLFLSTSTGSNLLVDPNITHSVQLVVDDCNPCTFDRDFAFADSTVSIAFTGTGLTTSDVCKFVPVQGNTQGLGTPCSDLSNAFTTTITSVNTTHSVFAATVPANSQGTYFACYRNGASANAFQLIYPKVFTVLVPVPTQAASCPTPTSGIRGGMNLTLEFSRGSTDLISSLASARDLVKVVRAPSTCLNDGGSSSSVAAVSISGTIDRTTWYVPLPHFSTTANYSLCYFQWQDVTWRAVSVLTVAPSSPGSFTPSPNPITVGMTGASVTLFGSGFSGGDNVYLVDSTNVASCYEDCSHPASPISISDPFMVDSSSTTQRILTFTSALSTQRQVRICYRYQGSILTVAPGVLSIGAANPASWAANGTIRQGSMMELNFTGSGGLGSADVAFLVANGASCATAPRLTTGIFNRVDPTSTAAWSIFLFGFNVPVAFYTVCYQRNNSLVTSVAPLLEVLPMFPTTFTTSNSPMDQRTFNLTFPEWMNGAPLTAQDEASIVCGTCSCWGTPSVATLYGNSYASMSAVGPFARIALSSGTYRVCYRISDGGWLALPTTLIVSALNPSTATISPPTPRQGNRVSFTVTGVGLAPGDTAFIALSSRKCFEPDFMNPTDVVGAFIVTTVGGVSSTTTIIQHFPSRGTGSSAYTFPLNITLCYRLGGQREFGPASSITLLPPQPSSFTTVPAVPRQNNVNVSLSFNVVPNSNDQVFIVQPSSASHPRPCDDAGSIIWVSQRTASPTFVFDAPPTSIALVVCYLTNGIYLAEVPQDIAFASPNPAAYSWDGAGITPRYRQYVTLRFTGSSLSAFDSLVVTDIPCANSRDSSPFVARQGTGTPTPTTFPITVQLMDPSTAATRFYLCYYHNASGVWSQVPAPLQFQDSVPQSPATADPTLNPTPRMGQKVRLVFPSTAVNLNPTAWGVPFGQWCHNTTGSSSGSVASLALSPSVGDLVKGLWDRSGDFTLCVQDDDAARTIDVSTTSKTSPSRLSILPPNPSTWTIFPNPPRVGQRVTATFNMVSIASPEDSVKLVAAGAICEDNVPLTSLPTTASYTVTVKDTTTTQITFLDPLDTLKYRAFNNTTTFTLCYSVKAEVGWSAAGGTAATSLVTISPQAPSSWSVFSGRLFTYRTFTLLFSDTGSNLNATGDDAWLAPNGTTCATPTCTGCIPIGLSADGASPAAVLTTGVSGTRILAYHVCYRLRGATGAAIPPMLQITAGEVECSITERVRVGQRLTLSFRKKNGIDATADSFRVSLLPSTLVNPTTCTDRYVSDFPSTVASILSSTNTTVSYTLEWPVNVSSTQYQFCYQHNGEVGALCTCNQQDTLSDDCFVAVDPAIPSAFDPYPNPTYVGQTINLTLTVPTAVTAVTQIALIPDVVLPFTTCRDTATSGTLLFASTNIVQPSGTTRRIQFRFSQLWAATNYIVCALVPTVAAELSRVPQRVNLTSDHQLQVRPYLSLSVLGLPREDQTLVFQFQHTDSSPAHANTNVFDAGDSIYLVADPNNCVESYLNTIVSDPNLLETPQSLPVLIDSFTVAPFFPISSRELVLRRAASYWVCYRLAGATWAPVMTNPVTIGPTLFPLCQFGSRHSTLNSVRGDPSRAMQYIHLNVAGVELASTFATSSDSVSFVPYGTRCTNSAASVWNSTVTVQASSNRVKALLWGPTARDYTVCYKISTQLFSSPACRRVTLQSPFPSLVKEGIGCPFVGQSVSLDLVGLLGSSTSRVPSFHYPVDRARVIDGTDDCDAMELSKAINVSSDVTMSTGSTQPATGSLLTSLTGVTIPTARFGVLIFGFGDRQYKVCYTNSNGTSALVPYSTGTDTTGKFSVRPRYPATYTFFPPRPQAGQLVLLTFNSPANPALVPAAPASTLPWNAPAYDPNTFDGAAFASVQGAVYREGFCMVRAPTLGSTVGTNSATVAAIYPDSGPDTIIPCYRPFGCSYTDVPSTLRIFDYNPISTTLFPAVARRGQRLRVTYFRNLVEVGALWLTPKVDLGSIVPAAPLVCTSTQDTSSVAALTNGSSINMTTIPGFFAPEGTAFTARACYRLINGTWSNVPNSDYGIAAANPSGFTTFPPYPTTSQQVFVTFLGSNLGPMDRAKIIPLNANCEENDIPAGEMNSLAFQTYANVPWSPSGWFVTQAAGSTTQTTLNLTATVAGNYSMCYRLASDEVWTFVSGTLRIWPRNPATVVMTPVSALEGELFTLQFFASDPAFLRAPQPLTRTDVVELYLGQVSCPARPSSDVVVTSPSKSIFLPSNLSFQLAAGTRGSYTLCYVTLNPSDGSRIVSFGFPMILIDENPKNASTSPYIARRNQITGIVFFGHGLSAGAPKSDEFRILDLTSQCQLDPNLMANSPDIEIRDFTANGNTSTVTVVSRKVATYRLCYKLFGGIWHNVSSLITFLPSNPDVAALSKSVIRDNELLRVDMTYGSDGWRQGDSLFASIDGCRSSVATADLSLDPTTRTMYSTLRLPFPSVNVSLCYSAPSTPPEGAVSIITDSLQVLPGTPVASNTPISIRAMQVLNTTLAMALFSGDYIRFVGNTSDCVGVISPIRTSEAWSTITPSPSGALTTVFFVLPTPGRNWMCTAHREAECSVSGRECGRTVVEYVVSSADPWDWDLFGTLTAHVSARLQVSFVSNSNRPTTGDRAWFALLRTPTTHPATACLDSLTNSTNTFPLTQVASASGTWSGVPTVVGQYTPCYLRDGDGSQPTIFANGKVLNVEASTATAVTLVTADAVVGAPIVLEVTGSGLGSDDLCFLVPEGSPCIYTVNGTAILLSAVLSAGSSDPITGVSALRWTNTLATASRYQTCYLTRSNSSYQSPFTLPSNRSIRASPLGATFLVSSVVNAMSILTAKPVVGVAVELSFSGASLRKEDQAGLISLNGRDVNTLSAQSVCLDATYGPINELPSTSNSIYRAIPVQGGTYLVCYKPLYSRLPTLIVRPPVTVANRSVVGLSFLQLPSGCTVLQACSAQPRLVMIDNSGLPTQEPNAQLSLALVNATSDELFPVSDLSRLATGLDSFSVVQNTYFNFYDLQFGLAGTFKLRATILLDGNVQYATISMPFNVAFSSAAFQHKVYCDRTAVHRVWDNGTQFSCFVQRLSTMSVSSYYPVGLAPSVGVASAVAWNPADVSTSTFSYTPDYSERTPYTNMVTLTILPNNAPYGSQLVLGSPLNLFIASIPSTSTSKLSCVAVDSGLDAGYIRAGGKAQCTLSTFDGAGNPVYTQTSSWRLQSQSLRGDGTSSNSTDFLSSTNLAPNPVHQISFTAVVPSLVNAQYFVIRASAGTPVQSTRAPGSSSINTSTNATSSPPLQSDPTTFTWAEISSSPARFSVVGVPSTQSFVLCTSTMSQSTTVFTPSELVPCVFNVRALGGESFAVSDELDIKVDGGSAVVVNLPTGLIGSALPFTIRSPVAIGAIGARRQGTPAPPASLTGVVTPDATDQSFSVSVQYKGQTLTTMRALIAFVNKVEQPTDYVVGREMLLVVSGSAISASDTFLLAESASCTNQTNTGLPSRTQPVVAQSGAVEGTVKLIFQTPPYAFYLCFSPNGTNKFALLDSTHYNNRTVTPTTSTLDDSVVVLIVGLILLLILVLLLPIVVWAILRERAQLFIPPKVNDQYVSGPRPGDPQIDSAAGVVGFDKLPFHFINTQDVEHTFMEFRQDLRAQEHEEWEALVDFTRLLLQVLADKQQGVSTFTDLKGIREAPDTHRRKSKKKSSKKKKEYSDSDDSSSDRNGPPPPPGSGSVEPSNSLDQRRVNHRLINYATSHLDDVVVVEERYQVHERQTTAVPQSYPRPPVAPLIPGQYSAAQQGAYQGPEWGPNSVGGPQAGDYSPQQASVNGGAIAMPGNPHEITLGLNGGGGHMLSVHGNTSRSRRSNIVVSGGASPPGFPGSVPRTQPGAAVGVGPPVNPDFPVLHFPSTYNRNPNPN